MPVASQGTFHPVVLQGWTLVYEMFFYIIFAATLFADKRLRLWLAGGALAFVVFIHSLLPSDSLQALGNPILLEFVAGLAIGRLWTANIKFPVWTAAALLVAGVIFLATVDDLSPHGPRLLRWGIPAAMIVAGSIFLERARPSPSIYFLKLLGDASYSIYLWHILLLVVVDNAFLKINLPLALHVCLVAVTSVAGTLALYFLIEQPLSDFLNRKVRQRNRSSLNMLARQT
jgi:exopolysaccharide production protein ExoZ